jgi:outer membrane protein OmpA-like peptidoglycan-associated protein
MIFGRPCWRRAASKDKTRGLKDEEKARASSGKSTMLGRFLSARADGVSFPISFGVESAALRADARQILDGIGEALNSEALRDTAYTVEGHTDATGSREYNLELSQRRAEAVRDYLVRNHGISASRLDAVGRGESDLADPSHPSAPENRRIRFVKRDGG